jgi:hypothetical protein
MGKNARVVRCGFVCVCIRTLLETAFYGEVQKSKVGHFGRPDPGKGKLGTNELSLSQQVRTFATLLLVSLSTKEMPERA